MAQTIQGKKIIVGTPLTTEDLFHELKSICEDNKKSGKPFDYSTDWNVLWYPCILDYGLKTERPLWKERYTLKELYSMRKQMGEYMFNQEMMCNPIEVGSGFFPREFILNACDDTLGFSYNTDGITYLGCDFAVSESVTGDYNVFVVVDSINGNIKRKFDFGDGEVELEVENPVIIRYIDRFKGGVGQVDRIEELAKRYNVSKIIVDGTGFGFRFAQEIRDRGLSVDAQNFAPANRSNLLVNLRKLFETTNVKTNPPRLVIPTSQKDGSYNVTKVLINELSGFVETKTRGGFSTIASKLKHDDTVMALALAVKDIVSSRKIVGKIFWEIKKDNKSIRSVPFFK